MKLNKSQTEKQETNLGDLEKVLLMSTTQMSSPLDFLDSILHQNISNLETTKLLLGTNEGIYPNQYPNDVKEQVVDMIKENKYQYIFSNIIEYGLDRTKDLLQTIKSELPEIKVVVGGPYAIEYPQECADLDFIDIVNYTHGLHSHEIVSSSENLSEVPNIMYKDKNRKIIKNSPIDINHDMEELPTPNWNSNNKVMLFNPSWTEKQGENKNYLISLEGIENPIPVEHHQVPHKNTGVVVLSKGCAMDCDFCSISRMYETENELYEEENNHTTTTSFKGIKINNQTNKQKKSKNMKRFSWFSPEKAIKTLEKYISTFPGTEYILFNDNDFASIPKKNVDDFLRMYKEKINLPFYCQNTPNFTAQKGEPFLEKMIEAGLDTYCIGAQSSEKTNELYDRKGGNKLVTESMRILNKYASKNQIHVAVDFINGNASETKENLEETIRFVKSLPTPWNLAIHNLTLDEKTSLAQKIKKNTKQNTQEGDLLENSTSDYHTASYNNFKPLNEPYLNTVMQWLGGLHNEENIGCLKRNSEDFYEQIKDTRKKFPEFNNLIKRKTSEHKNTYDLLLDSQVYSFLSKEHDVMHSLYENMPGIQYGYHRKNRYEYDWNFAKNQISTF